VGENIRNKYLNQTAACPLDFLYDSLEMITECELQLKERRNQRLFLEITFVKLCRLTDKKKTPAVVSEPQTATAVPTQQSSTAAKTELAQSKTPQQNPASQQTTIVTPKPGPQTSVSMPSLKEMLNGLQQGTLYNKSNTDTNVVAEKSSQRNQPFTTDQLIAAYQKFVESIKNQHMRFYSALHQTPKVSGQNTLIIELLNQTVLDDFQQTLKHQLQQFVRDELSNDNIVIEAKLAEVGSQHEIPYTGEEKLKFLISKNAVIGQLRQQLNLDLE
jgi:DNA polymerase III gamma/tau subunit